MTRPVRFPLLVRRGRLWAAKVRVPAGVRATLGRSVFIRTTGEADPVRAMIKAQPWIDHWKALIADAKAGKGYDLQDRIAEARNGLVTLLKEAQAQGKDQDVSEAVRCLMFDLGMASPTVQVAASMVTIPAMITTINPAPAVREATPFCAHINAWEAQLGLGAREASMYASDVRAFSKLHPKATVEGLDGATVQAWVGGLGLAPKTIKRKLSALRNYWEWLQATDVAAATATPFHGRKLPKRCKSEVVKRAAFDPADIPKLIAEARAARDGALADLITLGAYTGARVEELCSLKAEHVKGGDTLAIPGTKTDAAARAVPVHSAIRGLVDRLATAAQPTDGYLIPSAAENRYGERSAPLSKRFGRLKTKLGYGPAYVFHSLRKSVATLLEDAGTPESVAADVLGHDHPTLTFGLYSGGASLATKREWLERAVRYPPSA